MNLTRAAVIVGSMLTPLVLLAGSASAQGYPTPVGNIVITSECPDYPGGSASIYATINDLYGNAVVGTSVTFSVSSQAASDTGFVYTSGGMAATATVRTDESGQATAVLKTGSAPGTYAVRAVSGEKVAQVSCYLASGKGEEPGLVLPNTGTGLDEVSTNRFPFPLGLAAAIGIVVTGSIGIWRRSITKA
jgi:hypothetical protein